MVEEMVIAGAMTEVEWDRIDHQCQDVVVSLLDHPLRESHYENVGISGLAVMGLRPDGGWVAAEDYTSNYSAIIKLARMLVVRQAVVEREEEVAERVRGGMDEKRAKEASTSLFQLVRGKVQRFMTTMIDRTVLTPMEGPGRCEHTASWSRTSASGCIWSEVSRDGRWRFWGC